MRLHRSLLAVLACLALAAPAAASARPVEQFLDDPARCDSVCEQEVLACIARGESNKEIARTLHIAETTVKIHVQHILRKLGLSSRVQAAVYAAAREPRS